MDEGGEGMEIRHAVKDLELELYRPARLRELRKGCVVWGFGLEMFAS